ncbi:MAG: AbrB/MazE/SpoVT family DNA-binding domain-containing protein [Candidatus Woesearchaeota archaeon]
MTEVEITSTSVKGQVVIPQKIREELGIVTGTRFAAYGKDDMVILKKIKTPPLEEFEKIAMYGRKIARKMGIKSEKDVDRIIHERRGIKSVDSST